MDKKREFGCIPKSNCCKVESIISIDERGQLVLPKDLREKAKICGGDKFAVITWGNDNDVCCISLVKTDAFINGIKDIFGPMMKEMFKKKEDKNGN